MIRQSLSLRWLDTFRHVAQSGSVQHTADQTGQSISTVSQHLKALEDHLGVSLLNHARRPMVLTPQGVQYLRYAEDVLGLLDKAQAEVAGGAATTLRALRFAMVEDFETDLGPDITRMLAAALPGCRFTHLTRPSHEILALLRNRELDLGVATQPQFPVADMDDIPVLRDPFVLAVPANGNSDGEEYISGQSGLPLLRYSQGQIMGQMIEAQLTRLKLRLDNTFELDSTSSIMALIAQGQGWAITTPTNFARSKRFQGQVTLLPFPRKDFARTLSIFVADPKAVEVAQTVSTAMRSLLATHTLTPVIGAYPWLNNRFRVLSD